MVLSRAARPQRAFTVRLSSLGADQVQRPVIFLLTFELLEHKRSVLPRRYASSSSTTVESSNHQRRASVITSCAFS